MKSMTAYACVHKTEKEQSVQIALRSTNFKYLNVSLHNFPPENMELEEKIKKEINRKIKRGKIEVYVFSKYPPEGKIRINEKALSQYVSQAKKLARKHKLKPDIRIKDFLALPQVVWVQEKKHDGGSLIFLAAKEAIKQLLEFKKKEGEAIKREMNKNLRKLKANTEKMRKHKPKAACDGNTKEDIDEEISLISFYLDKMQQSISSEKTVSSGKSIDFLTQELLRELNAASSKTKKKSLAATIVESKSYLGRIREQAQNIE
ncbi:MAG: DUF1732 domain-containing protein [Candidatus Omnitrophica bacterium]|nr:DUF1732 domain-containing protein [Candidatus Omnitrophota bacterium]